MFNVVDKKWGTAHSIKDPLLSMAGKTGTCQVDYTTGNVQYISSFVGYYPVEKPMYSCIVVIHKPNKAKGYYGATVAAPVFKKIAKKIFNDIPLELSLDSKALEVLDQKNELDNNQSVQSFKSKSITDLNKTQGTEQLNDLRLKTSRSTGEKSQKTELE